MANYRVVVSYELQADSVEEAVKSCNGLMEKPTKRGWLLEVKELPSE